MFVELHILQNFAPSNLNRDDTGAPKDCDFGGYRRARISSQAFKRAMREAFKQHDLLPVEARGVRTRRLRQTAAEKLAARGRDPNQAEAVAEAAMTGIGFDFGERPGLSEYLLFLGEQEVDAFVDVCDRHWDTLLPLAGGDGKKKDRKDKMPKDIAAELLARLDGGKAADVALFGRMLADLPEKNIDAAAQVAHAISTHRVAVDYDYFTAVDDLQPRAADEGAGAGMIGHVEFNSACYYRYLNVDLRQLRENLKGDEELGRATLRAFIHAALTAIPTGKQNSMAAHNLPSMALGVVRRSGLWSLANAFVEPVWPAAQGGVIVNSAKRLDDYWGRMVAVYGGDAITATAVIELEADLPLEVLAPARVSNVEEFVDCIEAEAFGG